MDCRTQLASMAIEELDKGDFLMATKILTTGIRLEPNNHELYLERSICHHKLGDFQASLDDANAALRLNSSDYNIYYQKGLALTGLSLFPEAMVSFKKAIELRARQKDSKLSHIFNLLRDASNELKTAREKAKKKAATAIGPNTSNEPVDSTTDKPISIAGGQLVTDHQNNIVQIDAVITNDSNSNSNSNSNNLVATSNRNNQTSCTNQVLNNSIASSRVSSSASQFNPKNSEHRTSSPSIVLPAAHHTSRYTRTPDHHNSVLESTDDQQHDQSKSSMSTSSFDWNIRRSERIFLHTSNEPGTSGPQSAFANMPRQHDNTNEEFVLQRLRSNSNPSSIGSGKGVNKRSLDQHNDNRPYKPARATKSKNGGTNSHVDSDVDVGDNNYADSHYSFNSKCSDKRVMVVPSSSMPATGHDPTTATTKEDSYSSKYKRLRRDRERARRGTSKLCTIKLSELEELHKSKRSMRVIAPIDGWLYSGQLSFDVSSSNSKDSSQYVVKLDGDSSGSSYLFTQSTVLNDVIKEVRVKSVSELRKGARICCYWSRTYKCLSTGVVTSRTFEATKSLVSVKYDNGDLSALPLEDLRLLPPDYPKYMSNCDPLLLSKNNDNTTSASAPSIETIKPVVNGKYSNSNSGAAYSKAIVDAIIKKCDETDLGNNDGSSPKSLITTKQTFDKDSVLDNQQEVSNKCTNIAEDETIPPTDETIDFLTSESSLVQQGQQHTNSDVRSPHEDIFADDNVAITVGSQVVTSRASSEENSYNIEYQPWKFEGAPKRTKRNGRTYRDNYLAIRRGNEVLKVGDSAELMPRDESILPFIAKIDGIWANSRGEMRVRVRWYYRLVETEGEPYELEDKENALFETDHFDENDVQSIWRTTKILSWTEYARNHLRHVNKPSDGPKIFYLAGYYDPVRRVKHLRADVEES